MLDKAGRPLVAMAGEREIFIVPQMINRHGLITGATGTGKTVSLQTLAETFSSMGIPVFMADVKGDLSGVARDGHLEGKIGKRVEELDLKSRGYKNQAFPACFWDVFGKTGHPLRATISDIGPILLARLLDLNEVQSGVLQIIFRVADDNGLLLLDLKDLRSMAQHVADERESYRAKYGQISPASIGAIQRALLRLESEGGENFFGEPAVDIMDFLRLEKGLGVINILDATTLVNSPGLYSCVLLWLLSELYERLPEAGDLKKPRLVFFFDEAHLLFDGIRPVLLQKIEQVTRLIRSRGVGIFFISQNPSDIPDNVLGQLGNRLQHALRAFTPRDQKAVRAAAMAFRANPAFDTEQAISTLGVGEALVSFLDENGSPTIVEKALVLPPEGRIGPLNSSERADAVKASRLAGKYDQAIDRESAYEILAARAAGLAAQKEWEERRKAEEKNRAEIERQQKREQTEYRRARRKSADNSLGGLLDNVVRQTTRSIGGTVGREIGKTLLRGVLGSLFGGKR